MNKCLLIIDVQNDYFKNGKNPLNNSENTAVIIKKILEQFREKKYPIIHVQHIAVRPDSKFFIKDTYGSEIYSLIKPIDIEKVVIKNYPNSFKNTELLKHLKNNQIDELIICGMMTHMCISATTKAAFDLGFKCQILKNGCTTKDLKFEDAIIPAETVHKTILASLDGIFAKVTSLENIEKDI
jgi:nicotinamidase-related amidase